MGYEALVQHRFEAASDHLLNAFNAPPKTKWPPFEADLMAQLERCKYCLGDYSGAVYYAKQLLRKIADKTYLDTVKKTSFRTFCNYLIVLCRLRKGKAHRSLLQIGRLKQKYDAEQPIFFATQWIARQIDSLD